MFENILYQTNIINTLKEDISSGKLPPAILFSGPEYAGKSTTALELARVIGCEDTQNRGSWNCSCASCIRHKNLVSPDLLLLGKRRFFEDISASMGAYIRMPDNTGSKMLFIRSVRKLIGRFSSVLWEDDSLYKKIVPQIAVLEEELDSIDLPKKCESILKKAAALEAEGLGELISASHIRRASFWCRLAPLGKSKCIIIENCEKMHEAAKNSLLKILEETPSYVTIIMTARRPLSLLPTILSRLREYRFAARNEKEQSLILERVFREMPETALHHTIETYFDSLLPVKKEMLFALGAFFLASAANNTLHDGKIKKTEISVLEEFEQFAASRSGMDHIKYPLTYSKFILSVILEKAEQFSIPGLYTRFLEQCCLLLSAWLRSNNTESSLSGNSALQKILLAESWLQEIKKSINEYDTYNISVPMVLEGLLVRLKTSILNDYKNGIK